MTYYDSDCLGNRVRSQCYKATAEIYLCCVLLRHRGVAAWVADCLQSSVIYRRRMAGTTTMATLWEGDNNVN